MLQIGKRSKVYTTFVIITLHPKLEVPRLTCLTRESNPGLRGERQALKQRAIRTAFKNLFGTSTYELATNQRHFRIQKFIVDWLVHNINA